ncbi:hypothetical protein OAO18_03405 [Francisellaceae bacterium]|nr:hypothetical protein [Francisellaceae bacterium]
MKNTMKKLWQAYLKHNEMYAYAQLRQFGYISQDMHIQTTEQQISLDFK